MLFSCLPVPFADAARQRQYDAVLAALAAEADAPATVLLGNLAAWAAAAADALIVRPGGVALLVLTPSGGQLTIPALAYGSWRLSGQPLPGRAEADNPFAQYRQQQPAALAWLAAQLDYPAAALPPCAGLALFEAPLTFGPEVEARLQQHAGAHDFQLVSEAARLPRRLRELVPPPAAAPSEPELAAWAAQLTAELDPPWAAAADKSAADFFGHKLRQLWRWLGAEDIPADPPYGGPPPDAHLRDQQEQARLHQLRQELQAELHQQRQEAAAREAARTQDLAQLRQQLAQAGQSAAARRAEQQAQVALEASLRATRAELAARSHELAARIQQLGHLIGQLQGAPLPGAAAALPPAPGRALAPGKPVFRRLRQAERWGVLGLALAGASADIWGVGRLVWRPMPRPAAAAVQRPMPNEAPEESQLINQSSSADSLASAQTATTDTAAAPPLQPDQTTPAATAPAETTSQPAPLHVDSARLISEPAPLMMGPDSAAGPGPSP